MVLSGMGLVALGVLLLQVDAIATATGRWATERLSTPAFEIRVGRISGNWIQGLTLTQLELSSSLIPEKGGWEVEADTVKLDFRLLPLLRRTVALDRVDGSGVRIFLQLVRDGDTSRTQEEPRQVVEESGSGWHIEGGEVQLRGGEIRVQELDSLGRPGEPWVLSGIGLFAREVGLGSTIRADIESLTARVHPRGGLETPGYLRVSGAYGPEGVRLDTLVLETADSHVSAAGTIPLPLDGVAPEGMMFRFTAAPLDLRDFGPLLPPTISDSIRIRGRGEATSSPEGLRVDFGAETDEAGRMEVHATVVEAGQEDPSRAEIGLSGIDLQAWGLTTSRRLLDFSMLVTTDSLGGPLDTDWSARTEGIQVEGQASLAPGVRWTWKVEGHGSYDPQDGAPALPGMDLSGFDSRFSFSGEGIQPDSLLLQGWIQADTIAFPGRGFQMADIRADVDIRNSAMGIRSHLTLPDSGTVGLAGVMEMGGVNPRFRVDTLRFSRLNLGVFSEMESGGSLPHTRLNGVVGGRARMMEAGWAGQATLQLDSSRIETQLLSAGRIQVEASADGAEAVLELELEDGTVEGRMSLLEWSPTPHFRLSGIRFDKLDIGAFLGRPEMGTVLSGTLEGQARASGIEDLSGTFLMALDSSTVAGRAFESARLDVEATDGSMEGTLEVTGAGNEIRMDAQAALARAVPSYEARGVIRRPAGRGREGSPEGVFHATFGMEGSGLRPDSLQGTAWVEVDSARWGEIEVDTGRLRVAMEDGVLRLDTLALESPAATLAGSGRLPLLSSSGRTGSLALQGRVLQAEVLAPLVGAQLLAVGEGTFDASAEGTLENLNLNVNARVNALVMDDIRARGIALTANANRRADGEFTMGTGHLTVDELETGSLPVRRLEADGTLEEGNEISLSLSATLDDSRDAEISLRVEDLPSVSSFRLEELNFRADEDRWSLRSPARISLRDGLVVDSLILEADGQEISLRGRMARMGPLDLALEVHEFRIGTLSDLLGFPDLQGHVTASLALEGQADDPKLDISVQSRLESADAPPSTVNLSAGYAGRSLELEAGATMEDGHGFRLTGTLPLDLTLADSTRRLLDGVPLDMRATVDSLPLEWAGLFLPREAIRGVSGVLSGSVQVNGTAEDPSMTGAMAMAGLEIGLPALGVRYGNGVADLRIEGDRILLDTLSLRSGDGSLSASGSVNMARLDELEYALSVSTEGFEAVSSSDMNAVASSNLQVSGTLLHPVIEGRVELQEADLWLGEFSATPSVEPITLTEEDYMELARVFGYRRSGSASQSSLLMDAITLDLDVVLRRDSWIRQGSNPEMAVQFTGEFSVQKEPEDSLRLIGSVEAVPERSYVEQFGRRFSIENGALEFRGPPGATLLDITAEYEVPSRENPNQPEVTIVLGISGTPEAMNLELSSSPALEASDMVSYLAVGQPAGSSLGGGEGSLSDAGGALALGRLSGAVEAYAREQVGLDVVQITTDGLDGVTLLAGQYLTPELYLGIRQPISIQQSTGDASEKTPSPEFEVEFQAIRWLLLNLQAGGQTGVKLFVRSRISYE